MCMLLKETKTNILEISVKMLYFDLLCVAIPTILMLFPETYKPRSRCLEKHQFVTVCTREYHGNNYVTRKYSFSWYPDFNSRIIIKTSMLLIKLVLCKNETNICKKEIWQN